jgi:hypothetical protein
MMPWTDGKERVCDGSTVVYGEPAQHHSVLVLETPREVRNLIRTAKEDLLELHSHGRPDVEVYVERSAVKAVIPHWTVVE